MHRHNDINFIKHLSIIFMSCLLTVILMVTSLNVVTANATVNTLNAVKITTPKDTNKDTKKLDLSIVDMSPKTIYDDKKISFTLRVTNNTNNTYTNANLNVYVEKKTPISRLNLKKQLKTKTYTEYELVESKQITEITPGVNNKSLVIDRELLPLNNPSEWGPRKITLELVPENQNQVPETPKNSKNHASTNNDNYFPSVFDSTFLIWDSKAKVEKTKLSVLAPVTSTDEELLKSQQTEVTPPSTEKGRERLLNLMKLSSIPGVTLAVDPALFDNTSSNFTKMSAKTNEEKQKATETQHTYKKTDSLNTFQKNLLQSFNSLDKPEIIALPYANANLLQMSQLRNNPFEIESLNESKKNLSLLFPTAKIHSDILFADNNNITENQSTPEGISNLVVSEKSVKTKTNLSYSPSGITSFGDKSLSIVDQEMSDLFSDSSISQLNLRQLLLAHTAIITRQRPNDSRQFLIKLPNNFQAQAHAIKTLEDLSLTSWVQNLKYSEFINANKQNIYTVNTEQPENLKFLTLAVNELSTGKKTIEKLKSIIKENNNLDKKFNNLALNVFKNWENPIYRDQYVRNLNNKAEQITNKIKIIPSKHINLINSKTHIPVTITNTLSYPIKADMTISSSHTLLQSGGKKNIQVPAFGTTVTEIPVKAIANGQVNVNFILTNSYYQDIIISPTVTINVKANWEDTGTIVTAILLGLLFGAGLFRNIYRNKKRMNEDTSNLSTAEKSDI